VAPRFDHTVVATKNNNFIIFGGIIDGFIPENDLWEYSADTGKWTEVKEAETYRPPRLTDHSAVYFEPLNRMYVFGGKLGDLCFNDLWYYELDKRRWIHMTPDDTYPPARAGHVSVIKDHKLFVHGGMGNDGNALSCLWEFNFGTEQWRRIVSTNSPSPRYFHTAVVHRNQMLVLGGDEANHVINDLWSFSFETLYWQQLPDPQLAPRSGHASVVIDNTMYVFGGETGSQGSFNSENDLWAYQIMEKKWQLVVVDEDFGKPIGRFGTKLVPFENKLERIFFLFGGVRVCGAQWKPQDYQNDVWAFRRKIEQPKLKSGLNRLRKLSFVDNKK